MSEASTTVSVVIPAYNAVAFVEDAVVSVLEQTRPASEILVVDDGSHDGTAAVVEWRFGDHVRVVRKSNGGAASARNAGVEASSGDLVAFLDADDAWDPRKLEGQVQAMAAFPDCRLCYTDVGLDGGGSRGLSYPVYRDHDWSYDDVFSHRREIELDGPPLRLTAYSGPVFKYLLYNGMILPSSAVVARSLLEETEIRWDEGLTFTEDSDYFLRLSRHTSVVYLDAPLVEYRSIGGEARLSDQARTAHRIESFLEIIRETARETGFADEDPRWVAHCLAGQERRLGYYYLSELDRAAARAPLRSSMARDRRRLSTYLLLLTTYLPSGVLRRAGRVKRWFEGGAPETS